MRITFDVGDEGAPRLSEGDPLPPDDHVPVRTEISRPSLEALYRAQAPRLLRFFARRTDRQDAGDLVQESFVRFAGATTSPDNAPDQPEAYLYRIATNLLRNRARASFQQSVSRHVSADDIPLPANDAIASIEARDMLNRLEAAMARLSPKTREIFMAHRLDGLSYKEIGINTGLSVKGVEWHMSKAIAHIARVLSKR
jgi:RNA polymerase sigma factor (sigma-70 family)